MAGIARRAMHQVIVENSKLVDCCVSGERASPLAARACSRPMDGLLLVS